MADTNNVDPAANKQGDVTTDANVEQNITQNENAEQVKTKTFTQDEVSGFVAKESKKAQENLLKELGLGADFESVKDGLGKFKEWQQTQLSDLEKAQRETKKAAEELTKQQSANEILNNELKALKKGIKPESIGDFITLTKSLINDDTDVDAAMDAVLKKYPNFKGGAVPSAPNIGNKDKLNDDGWNADAGSKLPGRKLNPTFK